LQLPNPEDLDRLYRDVINIESITKRIRISEHYYNYGNDSHTNTSDQHSDPMDVDLMRIRSGSRFSHQYVAHKKNFYIDNSHPHYEEKKKGLCFICKKPDHLQFNCPEKKKPKNVKATHASPSNTPTSVTLRRIMKIDDSMDSKQILEIINNVNIFPKRKNNILEFYVKPEDKEEIKATVLIDSGSDLNFVHPDLVKKYNIKTKEITQFRVTGLGRDVSIVESITDKCILRFRNHFEIIQLYVLRIPDVDIIFGYPWINKHCPSNYHDAKKTSFGSGYCARCCNVGKRKRVNKKNKKPFQER